MIIDGADGPDHLIGGGADDILNGLGGDDTLEGLDGNDQIFGGSGNDHLHGGAGADILDGGADYDLARYDSSPVGVTVNLTTNTGSGGHAQGDTFIAIEALVGSAFADVLVGSNSWGNIIYGLGGDDSLYGGNDIDTTHGADVLDGGDGNDHLFLSVASQGTNGGPGYDLARYDYFQEAVSVTINSGGLTSIEALVGSNFSDVLIGDMGDNVIYGIGGDDLLTGRGGTDHLYGDDGNDLFYADLTIALMDGGVGLDIVRYENSAFGVVVNLALGLGSGGDAQGDSYTSIEAVAGSDHVDVLTGDAADNIFYGQGGGDDMRGGGGADKLYGGEGDDCFYFDDGSGVDQILDFATGVGHDFVGILTNVNGSGIVDYATLQPHIHDSMVTGITIDLGGGASVNLPNLHMVDITADLFLFYT